MGFFLLSNVFWAQELPPIELYSSKDYGAENQNWGISQSDDHHIYVANNKGLLEFNGAQWKLYPSPNQSIFRSVSVAGNRIYTGSYMDFGYWQRNQKGNLSYTSLVEETRVKLIEDEQFWNIIPMEGHILFQSLNRIYIYSPVDSSYKIVDTDHTITKMFKVKGSIYYQSIEDGLFKIENGSSQKITDDPIVTSNTLVNIYDENGGLLIQTQEKGFYLWKDNQLKPWEHPSKDLMSRLSVYNSLRLNDGKFILGTISNGMVYLDAKGDLIYKIDQTNGLGNNTVLSVFNDREDNVWLGLDNGINVINMKSPFRIYNDEEGKLGTVYASIVYRNKLYLGTNQGLFYRDVNSHDDFHYIEGTKGQVWCLVQIGETLFCGHNVGTFTVEDNNAHLTIHEAGTWDIKPYLDNPDVLLQGNFNGINVLHKVDGSWQLRNKIEGFDISSKYFEMQDKNRIFVSHEYKGVFELQVNDDLTKVLSVKKDSLLDKGFNSSLVKYNDEILYTYNKGVFSYDEKALRFRKDSILSKMLPSDQYTSGKLIPDAAHNKLWGFNSRNLMYLSPGKLSNVPSVNSIAFPQNLRKVIVGYETIAYLEANQYLLGTSTGYVIIDLDHLNSKTYNITLNSVSNFTIEGNEVHVDKTSTPEFNDNENNIEFSYSVPEFDKYLEAEYQYQLLGYYDQWSDWSTNPSVLFKNLPHGDYVFNVRARVGNSMTSNVAKFSFNIDKPWYISNVMVAMYILGVILFSIFMHYLYKNYYKRQKEKLLQKNKREMELKQLETEQQLMQLENEKLQQDIDSKSRELAISTMSLIKKNEFLNTIKDELKNVDNSKSLNPVIKFIDKNLNNTDDWKFFQEAFNNADKDFLKKIKSKHPSLTPNDLKLCAYLRLNLSSKEIAPLLNISTKSVEVKRYRLRKKMDLPHDYSLTNYILEI